MGSLFSSPKAPARPAAPVQEVPPPVEEKPVETPVVQPAPPVEQPPVQAPPPVQQPPVQQPPVQQAVAQAVNQATSQPIQVVKTATLVGQYSYKAGLDQSGKTIKAIQKTTPKSCLLECDKDTKCVGVVYKPSTSDCWLVNGFDVNQVANPQYDSYYKAYEYTTGMGLDQSGRTINPPGAIANVDVMACQNICDKNVNCKGIVYQPISKTCWTVNGFDSVQVKNPQYNSYYKTPYQKTVKVFEGYTRDSKRNSEEYVGVF